MSLLDIFKKLKKKDILEVQIPESFLNSKTVICYDDFYNACDLLPVIKQLNEASEANTFDIQNIRCNSKTNDLVYDLLKANIKKSKDKRVKMYTENYRLRILSMDMLNWGPSNDDEVPDNIVRIILPNNPNFKKVTREDLKWVRKNNY